MVTRRKYKNGRNEYFRGGRVPEAPPVLADTAIEPDAAPEMIPAAPQAPADDNRLAELLAAQTHAEELQKLSPLEREIVKLPISDHKKQFLMQHSDVATDQFLSRALTYHHQAGLDGGLDDDSPELDQYVLDGLKREREHQHEMAVEHARKMAAPPEPRPMPAPAPLMPREPAAAVMPPQRRSMPMSAPVSREIAGSAGRRDDGKINLSPEERDMAHRSIMDRPDMPKLTNAQKEYIYAMNKKRLQAMRDSGEYRQTTDQTG